MSLPVSLEQERKTHLTLFSISARVCRFAAELCTFASCSSKCAFLFRHFSKSFSSQRSAPAPPSWLPPVIAPDLPMTCPR